MQHGGLTIGAKTPGVLQSGADGAKFKGLQAACTHCGTEHLLRMTQFGGHTRSAVQVLEVRKDHIVDTKRSVDSTVVMSPLPSFCADR